MLRLHIILTFTIEIVTYVVTYKDFFFFLFFFLNNRAPTEFYPFPLPAPFPIWGRPSESIRCSREGRPPRRRSQPPRRRSWRSGRCRSGRPRRACGSPGGVRVPSQSEGGM